MVIPLQLLLLRRLLLTMTHVTRTARSTRTTQTRPSPMVKNSEKSSSSSSSRLLTTTSQILANLATLATLPSHHSLRCRGDRPDSLSGTTSSGRRRSRWVGRGCRERGGGGWLDRWTDGRMALTTRLNNQNHLTLPPCHLTPRRLFCNPDRRRPEDQRGCLLHLHRLRDSVLGESAALAPPLAGTARVHVAYRRRKSVHQRTLPTDCTSAHYGP